MEDSIVSIFVKPRNQFYCEYTINSGDSIHTKTYEQIKEYLFGIIPERFAQVNYALSKFQSFIIIIPDKEFIFLQLNDMTEYYEEMEEIVLNPTVKEAMIFIKDKNKLSIDDKIKKISELKP